MLQLFYILLLVSAILGYSVSFFQNVYLFHIVFFVILFVFVSYTLLANRIKCNVGVLGKYIILFWLWLTWILTGLLWASDLALAAKFAAIYGLMFTFCWFLIFYNVTELILKRTLTLLMIMVLVSLVIGTLEAFTSFRLPISPYFDLSGRSAREAAHLESMPTSFFYNPNNFAAFLTFALPFFLFAIHYFSGKKMRLFFVLSAMLIVVNILATDSSMSLLAASLIIFLYGCMNLNKVRKMSVKTIVMACLSFIVVAGVASTYAKPKFCELYNKLTVLTDSNFELNRANSLSIRATIFNEIAYPADSLTLLRGHGVGNTMNYLEGKIPKDKSNPHNWWLELLGDFGLLFTLLYAFLFLGILIELHRIMRISQDKFASFVSSACFVSMIGFTFSSMGPSTIAYFIPHWILISLSLITINLFRKYENSLSCRCD